MTSTKTLIPVLLLTAFATHVIQVAGARATRVAACVGETVTLECYSSKRLGVDWRYRSAVTSDGAYVVVSGYVQGQFKDRFRLNRSSTHQQSLVISALRINDQGLYTCTEDAGLGDRHEYQLTVHDKCNSRLMASSVAPVTRDENKNKNKTSSTFIGVVVVVFVVVVLIATGVLLIRRRRMMRAARRAAEYAEDSIGDVTEELDELRRSFSARLRSESLQRQSDNLEKDSRIEQLETILKRQLQREKTKDRKIAQLEERVEAIAPLNESTSRSLQEDLAASASEDDEDMAVESEMERGRRNGEENEDRICSSKPQAATSPVLGWETGNEPTCSRMKVKDERLEEDNTETPATHGQRVTARQTSRRLKIPFLSNLSKLKLSQTRVT